eukprot:g5785.t1
MVITAVLMHVVTAVAADTAGGDGFLGDTSGECPTGKYRVLTGWVNGQWGGCAACPAGEVFTDPHIAGGGCVPAQKAGHGGPSGGPPGITVAPGSGPKRDCVAGYWGAWTQCSKTCSFGGTRQRTRSVAVSPRGGGKACPELKQLRYCNAGRCPVRCTVSRWSKWGACSRSCGTGERTRTRRTLQHGRGAYVCPTLRQHGECNAVPCEVDCRETGYVAVSQDRGVNVFYWFSAARPKPLAARRRLRRQHRAHNSAGPVAAAAAHAAAAAAPLVLVLSGGAGCSTLTHALGGAGPCTAAPAPAEAAAKQAGAPSPRPAVPALAHNPHSWTEGANVLWVDVPGTGFSYSLYDHSASGSGSGSGNGAPSANAGAGVAWGNSTVLAAGRQLFVFVQEWLRLHPRFAARDVFVVGEDFSARLALELARLLALTAGGAAGGVSETASAADRDLLRGAARVNVVGVAMGGALVNPLAMFESYPRYLAHGGATAGASSLQERMAMAEARAGAGAGAGSSVGCATVAYAPLVRAGISFDDVRKPCTYTPAPYAGAGGGAGESCLCDGGTAALVARLLRAPTMRRELGVRRESNAWAPCSRAVGRRMRGAALLPTDGALPVLLDAGVRVLLWAGEHDYISNWIGVKAWALSLPWRGRAAFASAADVAWLGDAQDATLGEARVARGLTFVRVAGAGHRVAHDQPAAAQLMLQTWLAGDGF